MRIRIVLTSATLIILASFLSTSAAAQASPQMQEPNVFRVRDFGAKGDGTSLDMAAIVAAIQAATKAGGGHVLFGPGVYRTGTFELFSNITLELEAGAVLQGSPNLDDYGSTEAYGLGNAYGVNSSGEGSRVGMIIARNAENISIIGRGVIDGNGDSFFDFSNPHFSMDFDPKYTRQGDRFMDAVRQTHDGPVHFKPAGRPGTMVICFNCRNVLLRDVTFRNAPNWTIHFNNAERAVVTGIHIVNNPLLPNNDGFDCFGCKQVHVSDCDISTGDDDFAIINSSDVGVENCSLTSRSSGIRLEATRYSTFQNLTIHANRGLAVYGRGVGRTDHVLFSNIAIETQLFTGHWWGKGEPIYIVAAKPKPGTDEGRVSDITFSHIIGEAESSVVLYGSADSPLRNVTFNEVHFMLRRTRKDVSDAIGGNFDFRWTATDLSGAVFKHDIPGIYGRYINGLHLRDCSVQWGADTPDFFTSAIELEDFSDLELNGVETVQAPHAASAAISLTRGDGVSIRDSHAGRGTNVFLSADHVSGKRVFTGNDLTDARTVFAGSSAGFQRFGNSLPKQKTTKRQAQTH